MEPRVVHHVVIYTVAEGEDSKLAELEQADADPGWSCFSGAGEGVSTTGFVIAWAPGTPMTRYPTGTGLSLNPDAPLVMQVHYNLLNGRYPDRTRVRLELADSVDKVGLMMSPGVYEFEMPPGEEEVVLEGAMSVKMYAKWLEQNNPGKVDAMNAWAVFPHMHLLGKTLDMGVLTAAKNPALRESLVGIDQWDFNWQQFYFYDTPVRIASDESIQIRCTYDTTSRTEPIGYGEGTEDEMCVGVLFVTPAD